MLLASRDRNLARLVLLGLAVMLVSSTAAMAQGQPAPPRSQPKPPGPAVKQEDAAKSSTDPLVATVEGRMIGLSDVGREVASLPENLRRLPFPTLFPVVLDRVIDHQPLQLVEHGEMCRVGRLVAEHTAGHDHVDRRRQGLHHTDLHWRRMGP
jgi:hypothetical protein